MELAGKVAIVTGSSRGIGRAYALALAIEGATVVVTARTVTEPVVVPTGTAPSERQVKGGLPGSVETTASQIRRANGKALALGCDVTKEDDIRALVARVVDEFGKIDILVNNASIFPRSNYLKETPEQFGAIFDTNVLGMYLMCKHVLPHMISRRSGSVINISNGGSMGTGASRGTVTGRDLMFYHMSKAAINRMTTFLADEVSDYSIAVNALTPGIIKSDGMDDALGADFDYENDTIATILPATVEVLGPPLLYLAKQTAQTCTGRYVQTPEWGKSWP